MNSKLLRGLQAPAIREELRDAGCSERVIGKHRRDSRAGETTLHHAKNVRARKLPRRLHRAQRIKAGKKAKAKSSGLITSTDIRRIPIVNHILAEEPG